MLTRVRAHITHARRVWAEQSQITAATATYYDDTEALATRAAAAERIATGLDRQAAHLAASWLARAVTALPPSDTVQAMAADWRRRAEEMWYDLATALDLAEGHGA